MGGIAAQVKRVGGDGADGIRDWKTGEVGGACLFEKSRGKTVKGAIVGRKLQCIVADDDDEEPRLRPTTGGYAPNSSRKRRVLRTNDVGTLRDCSEGIEPVGRLRDDCWEIGSLGYALTFETLRTALLICLVIVRLAAAGAKHVGKLLDEDAQKGPDLGEHNKGCCTTTDDAIHLMDRKDSTTDDSKHHMDNIADLLYTTFLHPSVSV